MKDFFFLRKSFLNSGSRTTLIYGSVVLENIVIFVLVYSRIYFRILLNGATHQAT